MKNAGRRTQNTRRSHGLAHRPHDRENKTVETDYYFSNAHPDTRRSEFARVAKTEQRIEECIKRAEGEAGLADYEVRNWTGWHHHQIISLIATWFLVKEAQRGKMDTCNHRSINPGRNLADPQPRIQMRFQLPNLVGTRTASDPKRACSPVSLEAA